MYRTLQTNILQNYIKYYEFITNHKEIITTDYAFVNIVLDKT